MDRAWKHSQNASYSHFISPAHAIPGVPYKPAQMVLYMLWDAALLLHLVQNLEKLLNSRVTRKCIVWEGLGCVIPAPSTRLKISFLKKQKLVHNTTDTHGDNTETALVYRALHKHSCLVTNTALTPKRSQIPPAHGCSQLYTTFLSSRGTDTPGAVTPTLPTREGRLKWVSLVLLFVLCKRSSE